MTVKNIIVDWLRANGYDGLCDPPNECGCKLDDLIPCASPCDTCMAGYLAPSPEGIDATFWIQVTKPKKEAK